MRRIVSIPYEIADRTGFNVIVDQRFHYPVKETLYSPELKGIWTDVIGEGSEFYPLRRDIFEKCKSASRDNPQRLAIGSDHSLTFGLLVEDDIEQILVLDRHSDGAVHDDLDYSVSDLNCGTWGNLLIKKRPDVKYIVACHPWEEALMFVKDSNVQPKYAHKSHVPLKDIPKAIGNVLEDKKTALSFCADCTPVFKSKFRNYPKLLTLEQVVEIIKLVNDRTDLKHVDLMEISLTDEESIKAGKSIIETVLRL